MGNVPNMRSSAPAGATAVQLATIARALMLAGITSAEMAEKARRFLSLLPLAKAMANRSRFPWEGESR